MATSRQVARRRTLPESPAVPTPSPVTPAEPQPPDPDGANALDRLTLYLWLGGAALLVLVHVWHHLVDLLGWWN